MIRVKIPYHLGNLANIPREIEIEIKQPYTQRSVLDTLEFMYPVLRGTIRDHASKQRRPFVRFFACGEDLSHESPDAMLPDAVVKGDEPFLIVGAMAGG
ncbi:MoaD/ThiS family protein [bacterium]|nr:MoaD/ThiS family protein [bacterium]